MGESADWLGRRWGPHAASWAKVTASCAQVCAEEAHQSLAFVPDVGTALEEVAHACYRGGRNHSAELLAAGWSEDLHLEFLESILGLLRRP